MNKKTIVVNLIASPSTGKSTMSAELFSKLKWADIDCELVSEFAKELVWEQRNETFKDELYIFAKQNHRLFRVNGKVDVIITDRPLILSCYYNDKYGDKSDEFRNLALFETNKYNNVNYFITREKKYNPNGRNQTEEESNMISVEIKGMLDKLGVDYKEYKGNSESVDKIFDEIIEMIGR